MRPINQNLKKHQNSAMHQNHAPPCSINKTDS